MKKITLLSSVVASVLLFSCSSSIDITKKHYSNGYTVSITKNETNKAKETNNEVANTVANVTPTKAEETNVLTENNNEVASINNVNNDENTANTTEFSETKTLIASSYTPTKTNTSVVKKMSAIKKIRSLKNTLTVGGGGAVSPVILAILCIFIPPLAVFLKEGLTVNFWIDLILCLLFFIPGIIFAFLVCFDII